MGTGPLYELLTDRGHRIVRTHLQSGAGRPVAVGRLLGVRVTPGVNCVFGHRAG